MNSVSIIGRLVRDLNLYTVSTGKSYIFFTIAVNSYGDKTDYISCVAWNQVAINMSNYLSKGSLIAVSGRIATRKATGKDGKDQYITEVVAQAVTFLDKSKKNVTNSSSNETNASPVQNENKVNLDEAFKTPNYNTNIDFTNSSSSQETSTINTDLAFDDETIIWDH